MNLNQTIFVFIAISRDFWAAVAIMVNDFEINKIFGKKRRNRSFKNTFFFFFNINTDSRKQLLQRIASNIDNLDGDDLERRRSKED